MKNTAKVLILIAIVVVLISGIFLYFKNNTYKIIFYSEGKVYETMDVRKNRPMVKPDSPQKDGYLFLGWYTEDGESFDFDKKITDNQILVAHWGQIVEEEE